MNLVAVLLTCLLSTVCCEQQIQKTINISSWIDWGSSFFNAKNGTSKYPTAANSLNTKSCGLRFKTSNEKIVGGREANRGEIPWQVSMQMKRSNSWFHFCGGSIINNNYILTAAHCVPNLNPADLRIVLGAHSLKSFSGFEVIATAEKIIAHEKYDSRRMKNDIALIKLSKSVDLSGTSDAPINSVCLPDQRTSNLAEGELLNVSGWGRLSEGGSPSDKLQVVGVAVISNRNCNRQYPSKIYEGMLCAGYEGGGKDACQGDSGGPIVKCKSGQSCTLVGIVSWGYGCARPSNPGVYTSTAYYISWISDTIRKSRQ